MLHGKRHGYVSIADPSCPGKLRAIYYNLPNTFSVEKILTELSISQNEQHPNSFGYNKDSLEKLLLDEAEPFYIRIVEAFVGKCISEITIDSKPSSDVLPTSDIQDGLSTDRR